MVRSCCICHKVYRAEGVTFHSIPTPKDLRLKWIKAIGREVSKYAFVCNKHFNDNDIMFINITKGNVRRRLHSGAVPTLYLTKEEQDEYDKTNIDSAKQTCADKENQHQKFLFDNQTSAIQETENAAENVNTSKRRNAKNEEGRTNCHVARYVGDFIRDDFTSERTWKIFRKYYKETSKKLNILQGIIRRRDNKIKKFKVLISYLKNKELISKESM